MSDLNKTTKFFAFTLNNYTDDQVSVIKDFAKSDNVYHLIFGFEVAPTTGTKHLQGAFSLKNRSRGSTVKNLIGIKELHIEPTRKIYEANISYCKKSENYWEFPDSFIRRDKVSKKSKQTFKEAVELAKQGKFDQIEAEKMIKYDMKFKKIYAESKEVENLYLNNRFGDFFKEFFIFMHGPTGTGKSFRIDDIIYTLQSWWKDYCNDNKMNYHPLRTFKKNLSKWWDGYLGEEIVIIEELQPNWCSISGGKLKVWLDQYVFSGEVKGGTIEKMRPKWFIMTSNYTLEQLFTDQEGKVITEDLHPIQRRVYSITVNNKNDNIYWPNLDKLSLYFDTISTVKIEINDKFKNNYLNRKEKYLEYRNNKELNLSNSGSGDNTQESITNQNEDSVQLLESSESIYTQDFQCYYCEFRFEFKDIEQWKEYIFYKKIISGFNATISGCLYRVEELTKDVIMYDKKLKDLIEGFNILESFSLGDVYDTIADKNVTLDNCKDQINYVKQKILDLRQEIQLNYNIYFETLPRLKKYQELVEKIIVDSNKIKKDEIIKE